MSREIYHPPSRAERAHVRVVVDDGMPQRNRRWAIYAVCFLAGGIPAGVLARSCAAAAYGWAATPSTPAWCVDSVQVVTSSGTTCSSGAKLEITRNERGEQLAVCRCPGAP